MRVVQFSLLLAPKQIRNTVIDGFFIAISRPLVSIFRKISIRAIISVILTYTVKNAVELFFAFHPDVEKIQCH